MKKFINSLTNSFISLPILCLLLVPLFEWMSTYPRQVENPLTNKKQRMETGSKYIHMEGSQIHKGRDVDLSKHQRQDNAKNGVWTPRKDVRQWLGGCGEVWDLEIFVSTRRQKRESKRGMLRWGSEMLPRLQARAPGHSPLPQIQEALEALESLSYEHFMGLFSFIEVLWDQAQSLVCGRQALHQ